MLTLTLVGRSTITFTKMLDVIYERAQNRDQRFFPGDSTYESWDVSRVAVSAVIISIIC